jgi:hypothetical protein
MPNLKDIFDGKDFIGKKEIPDNTRVIDGMRPCSKCDLYVDSYLVDDTNLEMYWTCKDGHETRHRFG